MGATKRLAELAVAAVARESGPPLRRGPVRERARLVGQRRPALPATAPRGRPADHHRPRDDPLLHDDPRGVAAHPRGVAARRAGRPVRPRHGRAGPDRRPRARPRAAGRARPGFRADPSTSGCGPGEKLHESLFYDAETIEPTDHPKVLRARDRAVRRRAVDVLARARRAGRGRRDRATTRRPARRSRATLARLQPVAEVAGRVTASDRRADPVPPTEPRRGRARRGPRGPRLRLADDRARGRRRSRRPSRAFVGVDHAVAVNSATAALHLAMEGLGVGRGRRGHRPDLHVRGVGGDRPLPRRAARPRRRRSG